MKIIIPGDPIPWKRPGQSGRMRYDTQASHKLHVRNIMTSEMIKSHDAKYKNMCLYAHGCAIEVKTAFYLPIKRSSNGGTSNLKLWRLESHTQKPDCDNLAKFYFDCGNGILWVDDRFIVKATQEKIYDENPRVEIEIMTKEVPNLSASVRGIMSVFSPDEIKQFASDMQVIKAFADRMGDENAIRTESWYSLLAFSLNDFAKKYSDKLKKLRKYDEVKKEYEDLNSFSGAFHI